MVVVARMLPLMVMHFRFYAHRYVIVECGDFRLADLLLVSHVV